tara:strand:+ start:318 stop:698 length:381 start_codon:yes stop_codon:yes gene_type:complete
MFLSLRALLIALSVLLVIPACGSESDGDSDTGTDTGGVSVADIAALTGDATAGETVYTNSCAFCHTATGAENGSTPALTDRVSALSRDAMIENVLTGQGSMPGFASTLENQQIADVVAYVQGAFGG